MEPSGRFRRTLHFASVCSTGAAFAIFFLPGGPRFVAIRSPTTRRAAPQIATAVTYGCSRTTPTNRHLAALVIPSANRRVAGGAEEAPEEARRRACWVPTPRLQNANLEAMGTCG